MIHYSFFGYMIAAAIIMIICVIAYRLLFENKVNPSVNRLMLLLIYGITFLLPLIIAIIPEPHNGSGIEIGEIDIVRNIGNKINDQEEISFDLYKILFWISKIYFIGLFLTFLYSIFIISHLMFVLKRSTKKEIMGTDVYLHENKKMSSFSWCNKIFLYKDSLNSDLNELQMLVSHENAHISCYHWIDLALAQIVLIFQWFNPAVWFMRRELQQIHEYEADQTVLQSGIDEKKYQMLLIKNISGSRYSGLTDGLNNCSLKKRIIMMKKTKFKKDSAIRGIAIFGFALLSGLIIHIPAVANVLTVNMDSQSYHDSITSVAMEETNKITGDNPDHSEEKNIEEKVCSAAEIMPMYAGSSDQGVLMYDLIKTMKYPENAAKNKIEGRVIVRFTVFKDGKVGDYKIIRSVDPELDEEAINAIKTLPKKWTPGYLDKKPVNCYFTLPVTFKLQSDKEESK